VIATLVLGLEDELELALLGHMLRVPPSELEGMERTPADPKAVTRWVLTADIQASDVAGHVIPCPHLPASELDELVGYIRVVTHGGKLSTPRRSKDNVGCPEMVSETRRPWNALRGAIDAAGVRRNAVGDAARNGSFVGGEPDGA
jgi:hypothetical protein